MSVYSDAERWRNEWYTRMSERAAFEIRIVSLERELAMATEVACGAVEAERAARAEVERYKDLVLTLSMEDAE